MKDEANTPTGAEVSEDDGAGEGTDVGDDGAGEGNDVGIPGVGWQIAESNV